MSRYSTHRSQRGATLIEVLVSVVVSSVGLLGLAGLMVTTARVNQSTYQRTQAGLAVQALIESMHVNPVAVAQGRYEGIRKGAATAQADCRLQACNASARADYDLAELRRALDAVLPDAQVSLSCNASAGASANGYDGVCRIEVAWSERTLAKGGETAPQTLAWVFEP